MCMYNIVYVMKIRLQHITNSLLKNGVSLVVKFHRAGARMTDQNFNTPPLLKNIFLSVIKLRFWTK